MFQQHKTQRYLGSYNLRQGTAAFENLKPQNVDVNNESIIKKGYNQLYMNQVID